MVVPWDSLVEKSLSDWDAWHKSCAFDSLANSYALSSSSSGILCWLPKSKLIEQVPYMQNFKLWTFKVYELVFTCSATEVGLCVRCPLSCVRVLCGWLRFCVLYCIECIVLHRLPPPPSSSTNSSFLFTRCQPLYASYCTLLLYFSRHCTVRWKMFSFLCLFLMYYLCERYCKPITMQYHIANCISWVPRLTLLVLWTNWT